MTTVPRTIMKGPVRPALYRERHALLQRVLWSPQFARSERLRKFLEFVTEHVLSDPDLPIHEQEIGHRIFERRSDYDTSSDNIVRVTASQARKKLDEYFSSDGSSEPFVLEIPRGQYTPIFRERSGVDATSADSVNLPRSEGRWLRVSIALLLLVTVCLSITVVRLWHSSAANADSSPALTALWSNLFSPNRPTSVIVSDSSLSLYEDVLGRQLSLAEYITAHGSATGDPSLNRDPALAHFARLAFGRALTSRASTNTVVRIAQLRNVPPGGLLVVRPSDFNIDTMKFSNVVLLGSPRANPWVYLIEKELGFRYVYDVQTQHSAFQDRLAKTGEAQDYPTDSKTSYCRIAYLPNLSGNGNLLNIAGTETEGTEGGGEFATSENTIQQLRDRLDIPKGPLPYFEALLRSERVGGATPHLTIIAARRLQLGR